MARGDLVDDLVELLHVHFVDGPRDASADVEASRDPGQALLADKVRESRTDGG